MKWRLATLLLILSLFATLSRANERAQGYCVTAAGTRSLSCTVTVYLTGTTQLATIYADNVNTPQSNPFQADPTVGAWVFYAGNARYDINLSGGNPSISPAFTISDVLLFDPQSFGPMNASSLSVLSNPGNIAQDPLITNNYDNLFAYQVPVKTLTTTANSIGTALISQMSGTPGAHGAFGTYIVGDFTSLNGKLGVGLDVDAYYQDISSANNNVLPAIATSTTTLGTANFVDVVGQQAVVEHLGSGQIAFAADFLAPSSGNLGTGSINAMVGFAALDQKSVGIGLNAGMYVASQTAGANNYGIYSSPTNKEQLGNITTGKVNGLLYVDGSEYSSLSAAFAACPAGGCTIDMRGNASVLSLGSFDPGTIPVVLLLGPYTYTATQLTLETGETIQGIPGATNIQATSTTNPTIVISQTNTPAVNVLLKDFQLIGANSNTADGILLDCHTISANSGLWYSKFDNISMQGFNGVSLHLESNANSYANCENQINTFHRMVIQRGSSNSAGEGIRIEGASTNDWFTQDTVLGFNSGITEVGTNIYVGQLGTGAVVPVDIQFKDLVNQGASTGWTINGGYRLHMSDVHHEHIKVTGYNITGTNSLNNVITIDNNYFAMDGSYESTGSGAIVNASTGASLNWITFDHNMFGVFGSGAPDNVLSGQPGLWDEHDNVGWANPSVTSGFGATTAIGTVAGSSYPLTFQINLGATVSTSAASIALHAASHGWDCKFTDITTPATNLPRQTGGTTTGVTLSNYNPGGSATNPTANDTINASCTEY